MLIANLLQGDSLFLKTGDGESGLRVDESLRLRRFGKKVEVFYRELICYFLTIFDLMAILVNLLVLHLGRGELIVRAVVRSGVSDFVESFFVDDGIKLAHAKIEMGYSFFYFIALLIYSSSEKMQQADNQEKQRRWVGDFFI